MMKTLNAAMLTGADRARYDAAHASPVTVLQIGEGNFLRGFVDWMIHECRKQELFAGSIAVMQPRPSGKPKIEKLAAQDGLYTLVTRGLENGRRVERKEIVTVFSRAFDPYADWAIFTALAEEPELRFVVSNTTEAGLAYMPEPLTEGEPVQSFPGKITVLLYRRYIAFGGRLDAGLIFLPCELLARNGDTLKTCVLRHAEDWGLPESFRDWVDAHNRFLNSLVDRIVTGYPHEEDEALFAELGYRDELLNTAEPYYLWAIEGEPELDRLLPFNRAGLNVAWVPDLTPYQTRKVRILNGAHTLMAPLGLLHGLSHVRETMEHPGFGLFVRRAVEEEIIPTLPLPADDMRLYASSVYERFLNPFICHRLSDIAMNSVSKFKVRLLPTLLHYIDGGLPLPDRLVRSFAGLLRYCQVTRNEDGGEVRYEGRDLNGAAYVVRDNADVLAGFAAIWLDAAAAGTPLARTVGRLLEREDWWGRDLSRCRHLAESLAAHITTMEGESR